jgi:hypothetical protein
MAALRSRLLELDDELLVQHILSKIGNRQQAGNACKRLCKLVSYIHVGLYLDAAASRAAADFLLAASSP